MVSCNELDLIFTLFCLQVISIAFCNDLDLIFTFFCLKVVSIAF